MLPLAKWFQTGGHSLASLILNNSHFSKQRVKLCDKKLKRDANFRLKSKIQNNQHRIGLIHVDGNIEYGGKVKSNRFRI